ncbi:MAG TPA: FAD-binding oxidoreductase [Bryobacteraceae bacterium]|nr:FAD-binding oxidoreductase [Bryobacteraceae bacterium]
MDPAQPSAYFEDASGFRGHADSVYTPQSEAEVQRILVEASASLTPITISGAGTGVTGGRVPFGGIVLSLERFRHIDIQPGSARVGAGVLLRELQQAASSSEQFYAPDPTEISASIGGTIATNASGSRSFLYGDTRRHVLALRVALMNGSVLELRRGDPIPFETRAIPAPSTKKHTAGFPLRPGMDVLDLFIGSEGTLGVVMEAVVRLLPIPEELLSGIVFFRSDDDALTAVDMWREISGLRMLEYIDAGSLDLLRPTYSDIPGAAKSALLIEQQIDNDSEYDAWDSRLTQTQALKEASWFAASDFDRERFRRFRHALPEAVNDLVRRRGVLKMNTDFAVPLERNREMIAIYRDALEREFPGQYVIFGHIGDAHVHVNILPNSGEDAERAKAVITQLAREAAAFGGTVSAEHGLGKRKSHLLAIQYTEEQIESMRAVKRRFDPHWLLGRGTLFPEVTS